MSVDLPGSLLACLPEAVSSVLSVLFVVSRPAWPSAACLTTKGNHASWLCSTRVVHSKTTPMSPQKLRTKTCHMHHSQRHALKEKTAQQKSLPPASQGPCQGEPVAVQSSHKAVSSSSSSQVTNAICDFWNSSLTNALLYTSMGTKIQFHCHRIRRLRNLQPAKHAFAISSYKRARDTDSPEPVSWTSSEEHACFLRTHLQNMNFQ